jgi:hypothetical protein
VFPSSSFIEHDDDDDDDGGGGGGGGTAIQFSPPRGATSASSVRNDIARDFTRRKMRIAPTIEVLGASCFSFALSIPRTEFCNTEEIRSTLTLAAESWSLSSAPAAAVAAIVPTLVAGPSE